MSSSFRFAQSSILVLSLFAAAGCKAGGRAPSPDAAGRHVSHAASTAPAAAVPRPGISPVRCLIVRSCV